MVLYALSIYIFNAIEYKANTIFKEDNKMKQISKGKVRNLYDLEDGRLVLETTDRLSAFDVVLPTAIPFKGVILNKLSAFWFNHTEDIVSNHMLSVNNADMPKEFQAPQFKDRCMLVEKLQMLPIECIVRGYITGSGWTSYQKNGSVCGIQLPEGLRESEKLPTPIYTPTTKARVGHDEHISFEQTIDLLGDEDLATQVRDKSIALYSDCARYAEEQGIIIADTKFEFGIDGHGNLVLADEVLTPDSSRFWSADKYVVGKCQESYDKQYVRDYLKNTGWDKTAPGPELPPDVVSSTFEKYIEALNRLTGMTL